MMMDSWYCPIKIIQSARPKKYRFISKNTYIYYLPGIIIIQHFFDLIIFQNWTYVGTVKIFWTSKNVEYNNNRINFSLSNMMMSFIHNFFYDIIIWSTNITNRNMILAYSEPSKWTLSETTNIKPAAWNHSEWNLEFTYWMEKNIITILPIIKR